jgi:hypothetical protein
VTHLLPRDGLHAAPLLERPAGRSPERGESSPLTATPSASSTARLIFLTLSVNRSCVLSSQGHLSNASSTSHELTSHELPPIVGSPCLTTLCPPCVP